MSALWRAQAPNPRLIKAWRERSKPPEFVVTKFTNDTNRH